MNSLSWLLYAADISGRMSMTFGLVATFSAIGCAVAGVGYVITKIVHETDNDEVPAVVVRMVGRAGAVLALVFVISCAVAVLAPSRNTIMLIAASEVGETVLASPQAQAIGGEAGELATDSLRVLRKFINEQLDTPAPQASE